MISNKELVKRLSLIAFIVVSMILRLYLSFNNNIGLDNIMLFLIIVVMGVVSQILIMNLLYLDITSYINTHIVFPALAACESVSALLCSYSGNGLLGSTLLISIYIVWTSYKKIKEFSEKKAKVNNYKKLINYINEKYYDAEISDEEFNGKSIKFYLTNNEERKSYRVFIDNDGNITDMLLLLKEKHIDY